MAAGGQIRWPRPGRFVSGYGQFLVAVVTADNVGIDRERTDCPSITGPAQILVDLSYGL